MHARMRALSMHERAVGGVQWRAARGRAREVWRGKAGLVRVQGACSREVEAIRSRYTSSIERFVSGCKLHAE